MQHVAEFFAASAKRLGANRAVGKGVVAQLGFLGETNIKNHAAVDALQKLGKRRVFVNFGSELSTARLLPGIKIEVLGPPTIEQSSAITRQTSSDPDEFWHLAAATFRSLATTSSPLFPKAPRVAARSVPQEARWLIPRLDRMNSEEQLAVVRILDSAMNNTSVILLFDVGGTRLLFPGDAQIESWSYALEHAPEARRVRALLASTRVYKVGHHGSLNATPKKLLWAGFESKSETDGDERLITVLSTLAGKHGSIDRSTEVPRKTLVAELERYSGLYSTQESTTARRYWRDVEVTL